MQINNQVFFTNSSIEVVNKAVGLLHGFKIVEAVNDATTHVICGDTRRTMNVMRGVVRGAKLVKIDWVSLTIFPNKLYAKNEYSLFTLTQFFFID